MRNLVALAVMVIISVMVYSCSKNSSGAPTTYTSDSSYVKARIGDSTFSVKGVGQAWSQSVTSGGLTTWSIYGATTYGKTIQISMIGLASTGNNIPLGTAANYAYYYPYGTGGTGVYAVSGTFSVTQMSPNLVGTFSFICNDNTNVASGSFSVPAP